MLPYLIHRFVTPLDDSPLGFLRVFTFPTFQATAAILLSFAIVLLAGPRVIRALLGMKIGDIADFDDERMNAIMANKKNTPTMGGILIVIAIAASTLLLADLRNFYVLMALVCLVWLAGVGATDDFLKLTAARRKGSRQGLTSREKLLFQVGLGIILSYYTWRHGHAVSANVALYSPFFKHFHWPLGVGIFIAIGTLVITGTSNAVNLTDGLDGLAAGCIAITSIAFLLLSLIVGTMTPYNDPVLNQLLLPYIQGGDQMAVLAGAMLGACLGFLWYNANPARVFMGDTGSLAMGGLIGYIAIVLRQELMLLIIGGVFVAEAVSVTLQVGFFKYTRIRTGAGRRIFLMAPLHHHFQKKGWTETQVVTRFWIISAMLTTLALMTIKLR